MYILQSVVGSIFDTHVHFQKKKIYIALKNIWSIDRGVYKKIIIRKKYVLKIIKYNIIFFDENVL